MDISEDTETAPRAEFDEAWKEILRKYFKDFIELCWPQIFEKINWSKGYQFLEQEFQAIIKKEEIGKKMADKLVQIYLKTGKEAWVLVHLEIQNKMETDFSERIYIYRYRIFDLYKKDIATLVILTDKNRNWRPNVYETEFWGTHLKLQYPILKILDFKHRKKDLHDSRNPFAYVILAQLAALETLKQDKARLAIKFKLTKYLYLQGWRKADVIDLLRFLQGILVLPKTLTLQYHHQVKELEQELKVSYMTPLEKYLLEEGKQQGILQGVEKGIQQGESQLLLIQLQEKFNTVPEFYRQRITEANAKTLLAWGLRMVHSKSIEEVFKD